MRKLSKLDWGYWSCPHYRTWDPEKMAQSFGFVSFRCRVLIKSWKDRLCFSRRSLPSSLLLLIWSWSLNLSRNRFSSESKISDSKAEWPKNYDSKAQFFIKRLRTRKIKALCVCLHVIDLLLMWQQILITCSDHSFARVFVGFGWIKKTQENYFWRRFLRPFKWKHVVRRCPLQDNCFRESKARLLFPNCTQTFDPKGKGYFLSSYLFCLAPPPHTHANGVVF